MARQVLSTFAKAGRPREELRRGLRSYVVHPYAVFYTLRDKRVVVERILHGHLDIGSSDFDDDM
jgi:plasmid stabilization system protein ParE